MIGTVVEFAIVLCVKKCIDKKENQVAAKGQFFDGKSYSSKTVNLHLNKKCDKGQDSVHTSKRYSSTEKVDLASIILFTAVYIVFNIVYFT